MGQITVAVSPGALVTSVDRFTASNSTSGMSISSTNIIAIGEDAGRNITGNRLILLGKGAAKNSTLSDLIVIGENSVDNGLTLALATKSIVLGNNSIRAWDLQGTGAPSYPVIAIGHDIAPTRRQMFGDVFIGNDIARNFPAGDNSDTTGGNVVIGQGAASYAVTGGGRVAFASNVIIGWLAASQAASDGNNRSYQSNIVIGQQAGYSDVNNRSYQSNIVIGQSGGVVTSGVTCDNNLAIGNSSVFAPDVNLITQFNTVVGHSSQVTGNRNVYLGYNIVGPLGPAIAPDYNIIIGGAGAGAQAYSTNLTGSIILGAETRSATLNYAGVAANYDFFVGNGVINKMLLYGNQNTGCLTLGNDVTNRAIGAGATNALKILNGAKLSAGAPVGGGYFYVLAGALHWHGSGGTDTVVAPA